MIRLHTPDSGGRLPANIREAIDEKLFLLGQIASMAEEQAALAGSLLAEPEKTADFDRLIDARQRCMEQIDAIDKHIDKYMTNSVSIAHEMVSKIKTILEKTLELDKKTYAAIFNETIVLKNQLADLSRRKKSLTVYNTNILARKSMIVDKSR
ncbi:MAG: hypothetical protein A4E53_02118 [Pelotomaculum sp. PtaB.Bin104]|nr:MAG: hypothetical protein A4E53_02118 [Pelotomaculum sp. PtaB.Bin104]